MISKLALYIHTRLKLVSAVEQADLSMTWSETLRAVFF